METDKCDVCGKKVYSTERVAIKSKTLHKQCFKCQVCSLVLNLQTYKTFQGKVLCKKHYAEEDAKTEVLSQFYADVVLDPLPATNSTNKTTTNKSPEKKEKKGIFSFKKDKGEKEKTETKPKEEPKKEEPKKEIKKEEPKKEEIKKEEPKKENSLSHSSPAQEISDSPPQQYDIPRSPSLQEISKSKPQVKRQPLGKSASYDIGSTSSRSLSSMSEEELSESSPSLSSDRPVEERRLQTVRLNSMKSIPIDPSVSNAKQFAFNDIVPPVPDQELIGWSGKISRNDANARLKPRQQGTFLIRWSENANSYVLSYRDRTAPGGVENVAFIFPVIGGGIHVKLDDESVSPFDSLLAYIKYMQNKGMIASPIEVNAYGLT